MYFHTPRVGARTASVKSREKRVAMGDGVRGEFAGILSGAGAPIRVCDAADGLADVVACAALLLPKDRTDGDLPVLQRRLESTTSALERPHGTLGYRVYG